MTIQSTLKQLSAVWHRNKGVESVEEFDRIEASLGLPLPADYKYFMMWSNGGEGQLPAGYVAIYRLEELLDQQVREMKQFVIFGLEGDRVFAFDSNSRPTAADYDVVQFSLASRDVDEVEALAGGFDTFLLRKMQEASGSPRTRSSG